MVVEQNVERVLLLSPAAAATADDEDSDWAPFWPLDPASPLLLDGLRLRLMVESEREGVEVKSLSITSRDEDEVGVEILLAPGWPSQPAPATPQALFTLIQVVQDSTPTTGPLLVVDR